MEKLNVTNEETKNEKVERKIIESKYKSFGFENESNDGCDDFYYVNPKLKGEIYFEFSTNEGVLKRSEKDNIISGQPTKIIFYSYFDKKENKDVPGVKIYLTKEVEGNKVLFIISSRYTNVLRNIINNLLGCNEELKKLTIGIYERNGYATATIHINGKKATWKYSYDEQKKYIEIVKDKRGNIADYIYTDLDEFFETELRNHLSILLPNENNVENKEKSNENKVESKLINEEKYQDASEFFDKLGNEN